MDGRRLEGPGRERLVVFQESALFPWMSTFGNVLYGPTARGEDARQAQRSADALLEKVGLSAFRRKYPSQLSGGQQQRVAIARTLAYKPEVLLFDEPFGALDTQTRVHLRREIKALLRKVNVPSIFITHDQEEALELGDRVAVLNQGRLEQVGTPYEIYNHPATEYVATFLGAANILEATVRNDFLEVGSSHLSAPLDQEKFKTGDRVKIVFRPEDVVLSKSEFMRPGVSKIATARIDEISFVGAYERVRLRLDRRGETIIATRPKPETVTTKLQIGDPIVVAITSFTVLPPHPR